MPAPVYIEVDIIYIPWVTIAPPAWILVRCKAGIVKKAEPEIVVEV